MKRKTARHLTLIELMVSMGLALALLSFALYFYRYAVVTDEKLKIQEERVSRERLLGGRLAYIFSRLEKGTFYSQDNSLVFTFHSDAYAPTYHGRVLARLFVTPEKKLMLAIWQYNAYTDPNNPSPVHFEVLYEGVESLSWEFLGGAASSLIIPPGSFIKEWKEQYDSFPAAARMTLNQKEFAFPIAIGSKEAG